jgi:hypothetical protein
MDQCLKCVVGIRCLCSVLNDAHNGDSVKLCAQRGGVIWASFEGDNPIRTRLDKVADCNAIFGTDNYSRLRFQSVQQTAE